MAGDSAHFDTGTFDESFTSFLIQNRGFWNAPATAGTWRLVATLREPGHPEAGIELSWPNAQAQALACQAMGLPGPELPFIFHAPRCARALLLALANQAGEAVGGASFAEGAMGVDGELARPAGQSMTLRLMTFEPEDFARLAAGFALCAQASGGSLRCSDPQWEAQAPEAAARAATPGWTLDVGACFAPRLGIDSRQDLVQARHPNGQGTRVIDVRAGARALGVPSGPSMLTDVYGLGLALLDSQAVMDALGKLDPLLPAPWALDIAPGQNALALRQEAPAVFAARQEADMLAESSAMPTAGAPRPRM